MILQRPIERAQMAKLLETGKTDLLQFVSARTRRPFSAFLVKQADGKVGFEFEAKEPGRKGARGARSAPLRVLGTHPRDRQPVELHAGPLRSVRQARHDERDAARPRQGRLADARRSGRARRRKGRTQSFAFTATHRGYARAAQGAGGNAERPAATTARRTRAIRQRRAVAARGTS